MQILEHEHERSTICNTAEESGDRIELAETGLFRIRIARGLGHVVEPLADVGDDLGYLSRVCAEVCEQ